MIPKDIITQIQITAINEKVPWDLVCAIVEKESAGDTWAVRYEPRWHLFKDAEFWAKKDGITRMTEERLQMFSWGLGQVMGAVARELGFDRALPELCVPSVGILYCCKKIRQLMGRYANEQEIISAYNQGSPRTRPGGLFLNQDYVDRVNELRLPYLNRDWTKI